MARSTPPEIAKKLRKDPDFITLRRFDYSMQKLLERYPDGAPDRIIAQALDLSEEEVEQIYQEIVARIRDRMIRPL